MHSVSVKEIHRDERKIAAIYDYFKPGKKEKRTNRFL